MAFSFKQYPADGSTNIFTVSFGYLSQSHITVTIDGVSETFSWLAANSIVLDTAAAALAGTVVEIRRTTPIETAETDFQDGSTLSETELDQQTLQLLYVVQESADRIVSAVSLNALGVYDMDGHRVTNLADGVDDSDAVTIGQTLGVVSQAQASATASGVSAAAAATSEANAATSESNAAASATAAAGQNLPTPGPGDGGKKVNVKNDLTGFELLPDITFETVQRTFAGDGSTITFDLTVEPGADSNVQVFISGVLQHDTEWSLAGTNITFTEAPFNGAEISVYIAGQAANTVVPADGSINEPKLANNAVTESKIADGAVTVAKTVGLPITKEYIGSDQPVASNGQYFYPHGFGEEPKIIQTQLVCVSAEGGYSVGEVVAVSPSENSDVSSVNRGLSVRLFSDEIIIRIGANSSALLIVRADNGVRFPITNANWNLRLKAWA